jgi:hypothetical protein
MDEERLGSVRHSGTDLDPSEARERDPGSDGARALRDDLRDLDGRRSRDLERVGPTALPTPGDPAQFPGSRSFAGDDPKDPVWRVPSAIVAV